jgi:hypothetical protein
MIDFNRKLIYIHIPKTGGSSIEAALLHESLGLHEYTGQRVENIKRYNLTENFPKLNPHLNLKETLKHINNPEDFTIFTTTRNPYSRFISSYLYYLKLNKFITIEDFNKSNSGVFYSFTLKKMIGNSEVSILKQENLQLDFSKIVKGVNLPVVNTTKTVDYKELLNPYPNIIEQIKKSSKLEIDLLNYRY